MGLEIERKFLLRDATWRTLVTGHERMRQAYLLAPAAEGTAVAHASVRVRSAGDRAWLNVKEAAGGIARAEFEYAIPVADADAMLATLCGPAVEKTRHLVPVGGVLFEIDEFAGDNVGLVVAEVELPAVDAAYPRPAWLGAEVSHLRRYYNTSLAARPYRHWSVAEREGRDA